MGLGRKLRPLTLLGRLRIFTQSIWLFVLGSEHVIQVGDLHTGLLESQAWDLQDHPGACTATGHQRLVDLRI